VMTCTRRCLVSPIHEAHSRGLGTVAERQTTRHEGGRLRIRVEGGAKWLI